MSVLKKTGGTPSVGTPEAVAQRGERYHMKKRMSSLALALCMVLTLLPMTALAEKQAVAVGTSAVCPHNTHDDGCVAVAQSDEKSKLQRTTPPAWDGTVHALSEELAEADLPYITATVPTSAPTLAPDNTQAPTEYGDFTVATDNGGTVDWDAINGVLKLTTAGNYQISMKRGVTKTHHIIEVTAPAEDVVNVTLTDVNISAPKGADEADSRNGQPGKTALTATSKTALTFLETNTLTGGNGGKGRGSPGGHGGGGIRGGTVADGAVIATGGKEGTVPDFTSVLLPYAGFAVMRSDWGREANYLAFDGALLGYGHYHQDKLSVILHAYGREMLYDGGGGNYESSKWRRYSVDTFSHSTVLVDGLPQRRGSKDRWAGVAREPLPIVWRSGSVFDYAAASYDEPYGSPENRPASQRREVLFLKPDLFLVVDRLVSTDGKEHRYEARWHVNSTTLRPGPASGSFASNDADQPNLAIVPLLPAGLDCRAVSAQEEPELLGWLVHKDGRHIPTTT
ncbi:MAG: hypothetical protein EOM52_10250, partial [Clostridia bacterium]|nr:hypothetical protein [Clostridia bacterium]